MKQLDTLLARSVILLLLLLAIAFVYSPGLSGPFVLDDSTNIPQTKIDDLSFLSVKEVSFDNTSGLFGRPIPVATFALNHFFGDGTPYAFKTTNLAIHLLNTFLIFVFANIVINTLLTNKSSIGKNNTTLAALIISAIWSLHPIQVSTVMYSVQRMTMLMTFFTVLALITYLKARNTSAENPVKSLGLILVTGIFTILACLSKENGALIVLYVGLLEVMIRKSRPNQAAIRSELIFSNSILALVAITLAIGATFFAYKFEYLMSGYEIRDFTLSERLGTESNILVFYLKNILTPNITNMNLYLDDFPISGITSTKSLISYLILFSFLTLAIRFFESNPLVTFGVIFFFLSHTLESTFLPLELAFEHRNYTGTIGISIAVVAAMAQLLRKLNFEKLKYFFATITLVLISFQSYSRNIEWSDDLILNSLAVENNPRSERAKLSLAISLLSRSMLTEAVDLFEKAAAENETDAHTHLHLLQFKAYGGVFVPGDYTEIKHLLESRPITNDVVKVLDDMLTNVTNGVYKRPDVSQISELFKIAIANPNLKILEQNHAALLARYSKSLSLLDKNNEALTVLLAASELNPRNPEILILMAEEYATLEKYKNIDETLSRIPSDIMITTEQLNRIEALKIIAANNKAEPVEFTQSSD